MFYHSFSALGTTWWIEIFDELSEIQLQVIYNDVELYVTTFENRYSRFKPDSLISILNRDRALLQPDKEILQILEIGRTLFERSDGLFNILVGDTLIARGYDTNYSFIAHQEQPVIASPIENLQLSPWIISLTAGMIDLGGYGKGYLIDLLATRLQTEHGIKEFLINGGGDMYGTSEHGQPIMVYLEDPLAPGSYLGTTTIYHQGFAASSPHKRSWLSAGEIYTHIVDPLSKSLTSPFDATFIIADTACTADTFATVALFDSEAGFARLAATEQLSFLRYTATTKRLISNKTFILTPLL